MLRDQPVIIVITVNILLGTAWHLASFLVCIFRNRSSFSPDKRMYRAHKFEKDGRIYSDVLKINRWKDALPQHIGKGGFSKEHLTELSEEYVDEFIMETCRGEWNHRINCLFAAVLFIINNLWTAIVLTLLLLLGNLPFVCIQRYNRLRLQRVKRLLEKKALLASRREHESDKNESTQTKAHQVP